MTETDRILQAMTTMEVFTVADLVRACDASPSTVRTVLGRNSSLLEEIGREDTGRRGGKWKRYRLTDEAAAELSAGLRDGAERSEADHLAAPRDLLAAEEMLLAREAIDADSATRESLLRRARRRQRDAEEDPAATGIAARAHRHAVAALVALVEGEGESDPGALAQAEAEAEVARSLLPSEPGLFSAIERRIARSPLHELAPVAVATRQHRPTQTTVAIEGIVEVVQKMLGRPIPGFSNRPIPAFWYQPTVGGGLARVVESSRPTGKDLVWKARVRVSTPAAAALAAQPIPLHKHVPRLMDPQTIRIAAQKQEVRHHG